MRALFPAALATLLLITEHCLLASARAQSAGSFTSLATTGPNALGGATTAAGDVSVCSGRPWYDVACAGVKGDDVSDDTAAIQSAINTAVANNWPVHVPAGTYKVSSAITIDYAGQARNGFQLISEGATLDGRTIASGPVLQVECSGGTPASPATCFYFRQRGTLLILAASGGANLATLTADYAAGATIVGVSTTSGFAVGGTIDVLLASGVTQAVSVSAIGTGTVTILPGLAGAADSGAPVSRPSYPFTLGKADFSDQHNALKIDHLSVNNASAAPGAGGCQFNAVYDSDIDAVCDSAGGAAGIALEQTQFSRISGAGSAAAAGGSALLLEQGYNFSNVFFALDLEVAPTCIAITDRHHGDNTFVSPYLNCTTAVNATASDNNVLINPQYAGNVVNYGPQSVGISVVGAGSRQKWMFPAAANYIAAPIDDGMAVSSYNASGTALAVALPAIAAVNPGWSMEFATDNGKGMTISSPDGAAIVAGNKALPSVTLGGGNYEFVRLESDGNTWRLAAATRNTRLAMGYEPPPWPANWLYPSTPGYQATLGDNGTILSSYNTTAGLNVTLPPTNAIPDGWAMGFATDNGKPLTIQVNGTGGGHILYPGSGASQTSIALANTGQGAYEFLVLQYDSAGGTGNFRVVDATPATVQALGEIGSASLSHWSFPAVSAYNAAVADNGTMVGSDNSPAAYLTVTLPPGGAALPMGWTMGFAAGNNKAMSVQVNAVQGGKILYPGAGSGATSVALAAGNYEFLALRYDGANFRVTGTTPATATAIGMTGNAPGLNRWSFPSVTTYQAGASDNGTVLSSYNAAGGLTVTLPPVSAIGQGWTLGLATDNGQPLTVQTNATGGGRILYPAGSGGTNTASLSLAAVNYEFAALQFDGTNFRLVAASPRTAGGLGLLGHQIFTGAAPAPGNGSADCGTAPAIAGNDAVGRVTVGSGANGGKCTLTFAKAWPNPPVCSVVDETTASPIRPVGASPAAVAFSGTLNAGDVLAYRCQGYQ
ncbi:MAG TPA: glycosyl hydrolase family 28-related protein [Stellaceae bacterium]|nr:glycosyl hydrolase family 28-related protein [Stellaceae bacterium]